jgi:large conductance mechanosensitive channel
MVASLKKVVSLDPAKRAFTLIDEFKAFAFKGNVIDLAVGVIIGGAFGKIIDSLVKQIIMPTVSLLMPSQQSYLGWKLVVGAKEVPYGLFIGEVVNFLIVAAVLFFFIVKFLGWVLKARKEEAAAPAAPPAPAPEIVLLTEIRDLLRSENREVRSEKRAR